MRYVLVCDSATPINAADFQACQTQPIDLDAALAQHSIVPRLTNAEKADWMLAIVTVMMMAWGIRLMNDFFLNRRG
ncbi:hypothetical protein ACQKFX_25430 [Cupriavidus metallidurans]|uniref:hypothetical protein n=1 Tax=Cupriavidus metallidurans TaxID=119219 RepID=UPI003CFE6DEE